MKNFLTAVAMSLLPIQAWAHEGHGLAGHGNTVVHYVFDPLHLPLGIIACAALIWFAGKLRTRWSRASVLRS